MSVSQPWLKTAMQQSEAIHANYMQQLCCTWTCRRECGWHAELDIGGGGEGANSGCEGRRGQVHSSITETPLGITAECKQNSHVTSCIGRGLVQLPRLIWKRGMGVAPLVSHVQPTTIKLAHHAAHDSHHKGHS